MRRLSRNLIMIVIVVLFCLPAVPAFSLNIGHFDNSREQWGMSTGYISGATQWLVDQGHTLVSTNTADEAFLGTVDAFYTGLIGSIATQEVSAMQSFVDDDGGFLFIQQDHDSGPWHAPSSDILSNWGISNSAGTFYNDSGHYTVGSTSWVTDPNAVAGFTGAAHSTLNVIPDGFEVIARDDLDRVIMGVFDAGAGRSSDVFVATDIDFWSDGIGWSDSRNQMLWENIWTSAAQQIDPVEPVPEPSTWLLLGTGLAGLAYYRRKKS